MFKNGKQQMAAALCALLLCCGMTARPAAVETSAAAAILMEAESGRVLYAQRSDEPMKIASTTKIMTALVALEACSLEEQVEVTRAHMAEGSSMYLRPGEQLTLETLLYGLMLCSGNDAALAIADHCGPGVEAFVSKMNEKAKELGMSHTAFANPNGLDQEGHYSTARDMAVLAAYAMKNEAFARIVSTRQVTAGGRTMVNHNKLLSRYEGCIGLKTGFTKASGRTLVTCAERDGMRLVAVTLNDGNDWADHSALFDYGFAHYEMRRPASLRQAAGQVPVLNSAAGKIPVCYGGVFAYPVGEGETLECCLETDECVFAPVEAGARAGEAVYCLNGREVGRVPLYYGASAAPLEQKQAGGLWQRAARALRCKFHPES